MTSIQNQQMSRNEDYAAKAARRAGKASQNVAAPDAGVAFSSMLAASEKQLRAERLAATADRAAAEKSSSNRTGSPVDDNIFDDDAYVSSSSSAPSAQSDGPQGQVAQGGGAPVSTSSSSAQVQAASEESLEWMSLASLLPAGEDDGLFEVIMPNNTKVGVAVSDMPAGLSYLLMPEDDQLAYRLRGNEMELEGYLKRRIRRNVRVTVL